MPEDPNIPQDTNEGENTPTLTYTPEAFQELTAQLQAKTEQIGGLTGLVDKLRNVEKDHQRILKVLGDNVSPEQLESWKQAAKQLEDETRRSEEARLTLEAQLRQTYEPQISALKQQAETNLTRYHQVLVDSAVKDACRDLGANPITLTYTAKTLAEYVKVSGDRLVVLGLDKKTPLMVENGGKVSEGTIQDLAKLLVEKDQAFAYNFLAPSVGGVGSNGGKLLGRNSITVDEFNAEMLKGNVELAKKVSSGEITVG
jgi:hypothetical protein